MKTKHSNQFSPRLVCEYTKNKNGVYTSCGFRVAYNKFYKYCPYCGRPIVKLFLIH